uniref:BRO1 domain-containing protein n=1 Tax=Romanomermis culicivorax TaxID=13658 RepID=A0A915J6U3_ROMCU
MAESGFIHNYQRGHNPLLQTKRGKVQQRRGALNEQISKQIRLRNGAENLLRCSSSSKMPQLALGLKETKDVDFTVSFNDILTEHYFVDSSKYDGKIRQFSEMRKSVRTPPRNDAGIKLLTEYYNQLCFIEKRFYSCSKPLSTYFEWFDAVTGIPAIQRSVAFEKGSILFNIGALFTQLGANEDRDDTTGLQKCMDYYSRAVGYFQYLKENFSHSPSNDMQSDTLMALICLFLAQIQECIWKIYCDQLSSLESFQESFILAQESSQVV